MAVNSNILNIPLDGTGTEIPTLNVTDPYEKYLITGANTTIGNYAIVPTGTPQQGTTFLFKYKATTDITTNNNTFAIFGQALTQNQLLIELDIECYYTGSSWEVLVFPSLSTQFVETTNIVNSAVGTNQIANLSVTTSKLADGSVTTPKLATDSVTTIKILDNNITTSKILDDNVTLDKLETGTAHSIVKYDNSGNPSYLQLDTDELPIGTGTDVTTISLSSINSGVGLKEILVVPISFNSGEVGSNNKIFLSFNGDVDLVTYTVTEDIESSDNANVQIWSGGVLINNCNITILAGTAQNTTDSRDPVGAFNGLTAGFYLEFRTTKTTPGGKILVTIHYTRT